MAEHGSQVRVVMLSLNNEGKFVFSTKKFAVMLIICMTIVFSCWFYFQGRELDYDKGYNTAMNACNKYLENKSCVATHGPLLGALNVTSITIPFN